MTMRHAGALLFAGMLVMAGCSGSEGADGPPGQPGEDGQPGADLLPKLAGEVAVSNAAATVSGSDVVVTFNVKVAGINRDDFTSFGEDVYHHWYNPNLASTVAITSGGVATVYPVKNKFQRDSVTDATLTSLGDGNYSIRFPGKAAAADARYFADVVTADGLIATVVAKSAGATRNIVSDQACINCHGPTVFRDGHHDANAVGVSACVICHTRYNSQSRGMGGDRLASYVHGIHNSHNMPARTIGSTTKPAGVYARNDSTNTSSWFSIGFPGYMMNCATCHDTAEGLALVKNATVSRSTCFGCHDSFEGFPWTGTAENDKSDHLALSATAGCTGCHDGNFAPGTAAEFHNGMKTERSGLIWDGQDQSVVLGKRITMQITGVSYDPVGSTTLAVTWKAQLDGVDVDPCNTTVTSSAPIFHRNSANASNGQQSRSFSILRAYAQGDDWVANLSTTSPGQPISASITASNTTCASNVATTRIKADTTTATRGILAIQGKPQITFEPAVGTSVEVNYARAQSPVREFLVATGAAPAASAQRRQIVSIDRCNACHLGSMYQHGGDRVDRVELCIMCHNPASNEKQNRVGMGVDDTDSYDGKVGQTYDLKTMIHAIHSAGETGVPLVYYRSNGIYLFGNKATLAATTNWPDPTGATTTATVYGSSPATSRTHNFIEVHYPRALNDCAACHVNDSDKSLPIATKAVAVTDEDAGSQDADVANVGWKNQLDDVLVGPVAQSCMTCHQSSVGWEQSWLKFHAYDNGFAPQALPGGRQDLIDGKAGESCFRCHGAGKVADVAEVHK